MKKDLSHIHSQLRFIARLSPQITFSRRNLWLTRALMRSLPAPLPPRDLRIENVCIPSQTKGADLRLRIYRPRISPAPTAALLWLHGGGYVMGKPEQDELRCILYVREAGLTVVSVDYHCAPDHPFPDGLNDAYNALQWLAVHAPQIGVDARRLAVGGASAGGGLAASLAQMAHDRWEVPLRFQLLVYPMLDDRTVLRTGHEPVLSIAWNSTSNRFGWEAYLNRECCEDDPPEYAVPARRQDLSGLPPTWIGVGTEDLFHAEVQAYAQRLQEQGVACETCFVPGAFHAFDLFNTHLPVIRDFYTSQISALKQNLSENLQSKKAGA